MASPGCCLGNGVFTVGSVLLSALAAAPSKLPHWPDSVESGGLRGHPQKRPLLGREQVQVEVAPSYLAPLQIG